MDKSGKKIKINKSYDIDFGGWESEKEKLRRNLSWTPEDILIWLENATTFGKEIREYRHVLRKYY